MIDNLISKRVVDIQPSGIRKFFDIVANTPGVISLGVGEPDFQTPWVVREEAVYSLEKGKTTYTSNAGLWELRRAISRFMNERYNLQYDPHQQVLVTVGASEGIDLAMRCVIEPGDEVLIPEPSYVSYSPCVLLAGGIPVALPTTAETDFRLTADALQHIISERTKVLVLPYPNNPTGAIMEEDDLAAIATVLREHNLLVVSDEIYSELTYGVKHTSIASLPGMYEKTVVINGFSKNFAMTGWRLGFATGPQALIKAMTKIHQYTIMCCSTTSQYAAVKALEEGMPAVETMVAEYDKRRRLLVHNFNKMGLSCFEPLGAFYVFPNISKTGLRSEEFCNKLLQEEKVAVVPGTAFGASGEGFIRCSYAYSLKNLQEALTRISRFVENIA